MTHDAAFLADISESPDDDAPRLVYADWLDDHGQPDRAEFIRVSCALAKLAEGDPRGEELAARHRALLTEHETEWVGPLADLAERWWFERGFLEGIQIHAADLLRHVDTVFSLGPVRDLQLDNAEGLTGGLAACPFLGRVTSLGLQGSTIGDAGLRELLSSPTRKRPSTYLGRLRRLNLGHTGIGRAGLRDLLGRSQLMPELAGLNLVGNRLGGEVVEALAASPLSARLRELSLSWCLGPPGVRAIATSPCFAELHSIHLAGCRATDAECQALATSATLPMLTDLALGGSRFHRPSRITPAGIAALVSSPKMSRLRHLYLPGSQISDDGVEALTTSGALRELRWLSLDDNAFGQRGVRALTRSGFWLGLLGLGLSVNTIGDAGANELLAAPTPPRLRCLFLRQCGITEPVQQALRERFGRHVLL